MSDIKFINMTSTEWWMLTEQINAGSCRQETSGFTSFYKTKVVTPSGDTYIIEDVDGEIMTVEKLI